MKTGIEINVVMNVINVKKLLSKTNRKIFIAINVVSVMNF